MNKKKLTLFFIGLFLLSGLSTKLKVTDNQTLLDTVLSETKDDLISTGYDQLDSHIGGYS